MSLRSKHGWFYWTDITGIHILSFEYYFNGAYLGSNLHGSAKLLARLTTRLCLTIATEEVGNFLRL